MARTPRYPCGTCGKKLPAAEMIYSRHTGQRYCRDLKACLKRRKPRKLAA